MTRPVVLRIAGLPIRIVTDLDPVTVVDETTVDVDVSAATSVDVVVRDGTSVPVTVESNPPQG